MRRSPSALRRRRTSKTSALLLAALLAACGAEEVSEPLPGTPRTEPAEARGLWHELRPARVDPRLSAEQRELVARLESIGYAAGSSPTPDHRGVTLHRQDASAGGYNFYTSGHAPEAILTDMDGSELHRWRRDLLDVWPDYPRDWLHTGAGYWRRAHLFENGDVLAIFEGIGIVKLDRDSNLLWAVPNQAHHDLHVMPDGDIYVLTRKAHLVPRIDPTLPVLEDFISVLDADGNPRRSISLLEALERSEYRELWNPDARMKTGDLFHTNTLEVLDGRSRQRIPAFRAGNVLVSMLVPDLVAVVDLERQQLVWAARGTFKKQHDPKLLENGHLLLFDNRGDLPYARVLELDPARPETATWEYGGSAAAPFASFTCGAAERLPNGNTLITESDGGRAFEVTTEKQIVWEFYNPHRAGKEDELIATLFEVVRLPADFPTAWTQASGPGARRSDQD